MNNEYLKSYFNLIHFHTTVSVTFQKYSYVHWSDNDEAAVRIEFDCYIFCMRMWFWVECHISIVWHTSCPTILQVTCKLHPEMVL